MMRSLDSHPRRTKQQRREPPPKPFIALSPTLKLPEEVITHILRWIDWKTLDMSKVMILLRGGMALHVRKLDLTGQIITPLATRTLTFLMKMGACPKLEELDLSKTRLTSPHAAALLLGLPKACPKLRQLDISNNSFQASAIQEFANYLVTYERNWGLDSINLENTGMNAVAFSSIMCAINYRCPQVTVLSCGRNLVGDEGLDSFARSYSTAPAVRSLVLSDTGFSTNGAYALAGALSAGAFPTLLSLDVRDNLLYPRGAASLASAFNAGACRLLETLCVARNRIYADGALALTLALQLGSCPNLKSLDLRGNKICVKGIEGVSSLLVSNACPMLESLDLAGNYLYAEGVSSLASAIHFCRSLKNLDLGDNGIMVEGGVILAEAIMNGDLPQLTMLEVGRNALGHEGVGALITAVGGSGIEALGLRGNEMKTEGAKHLARVLEVGGLRCLRKIDVAVNEMMEEGVKHILKAMRGRAGVLEQVDLTFNRVESIDGLKRFWEEEGGEMEMKLLLQHKGRTKTVIRQGCP